MIRIARILVVLSYVFCLSAGNVFAQSANFQLTPLSGGWPSGPQGPVGPQGPPGPAGSGGGLPIGARVTLLSHTPLMVTSATAQSTLYVDCWNGTTVANFNGTSDVSNPVPACEVSAALPTSGLGALNANDVFDVFWIGNSFCVAGNGNGAGWSGDAGGSLAARGTGYSAIDLITRSYPTNAGTIAHCYTGASDNGPIAPNRATLLGSICTDAATPSSVSFTFGSIGNSGAQQARLCVWNVASEIVETTVVDNNPAGSWTWSDPSSCGDSDNALGGNRITFVQGLPLSSANVKFDQTIGSNNLTAIGAIGFSLDRSGTGQCPDKLSPYETPGSAGSTPVIGGVSISHAYPPQAIVGMHYIQAQQTSDGGTPEIYYTIGGQRYDFSMWIKM